MKVELRSLDSSITPYETNPRQYDKEVVRQVANSIWAFGWRQPIVVDEEGVILVGHVRRRAALLLLDEKEVTDDLTDDQRQLLEHRKVPVHVAEGLTEDQKRQYRLADNRLSELSRWDISLLSDEIKAFDDPGGLLDFGFNEAELLLADVDEEAVMSGRVKEPWEEQMEGAELEGTGRKGLRVVVHCATQEDKDRFLGWLEGKDASIFKAGAKASTVHVPAREIQKYGKEEGGEGEGEKGSGDDGNQEEMAV